jgi:hypothetical protein
MHPLIAAARILPVLAAVVGLAACSRFVGENGHNVPLGKGTLDPIADIGSSPAEPMVIRVSSRHPNLRSGKGRKRGGMPC